jgi:3,4-dihydroxy-2-butanone 4-phosphate synthase
MFGPLPQSVIDQVSRKSSLATIEEAIAEYRAGRMVIVMDDEDRENEGDLCMAAERVTPRRSTSWRPRVAA